MGRWSVAWRVHDAQFWGVPQRRKRIALVADFGGKSAPEILFERRCLRWNPAESGEARKETPRNFGESTEGAIGFNRERSGAITAENIMPTLQTAADKPMVLVYNGENITSPTNSTNPKPGDPSHTIGTGSRNYVVCLQGNGIDRADTAGCNGKGWNDEDVCYTLNTVDRPAVFAAGFDHHAGAKSGSVGYQDEVAPNLEASKTKSVLVLNDQGGSVMDVSDDKTGTPRAQTHGHEPIMIEMTSTKNTVVEDGVSPTLTARMGTGGNQVNAVFDTYQKTTGALCASGYDKLGTQEALNDMYVVQNKVQINATCTDIGFFQSYDEKSGTLLARQYKDPPLVAYCIVKQSNFAVNEDLSNSINASGVSYVSYPAVRRLTPLECERLQGFPDGWTDIGDWVDSNGKKHKGDADNPRYKALGNSIALPFWQYLARRICAQYERDATIGSLFDGIGGFPYVFRKCGAKVVWASEIEEFPMAVTKKHFGDDDKGIKGDIAFYL